MIPTYAAYLLRRLLVGHDLNGELDTLPAPWKAIGEHLAGLGKKARPAAWQAMMAARPDREELVKALEAIDPNGPTPMTEAKRRAAHMGDLAGFQSAGRFIWPSWLVRSHFNLLSSDPKIGKTHLGESPENSLGMIRVFCSTPLRCGFGFESWSRGGDDESSHGRGDRVVQGCRP